LFQKFYAKHNHPTTYRIQCSLKFVNDFTIYYGVAKNSSLKNLKRVFSNIECKVFSAHAQPVYQSQESFGYSCCSEYLPCFFLTYCHLFDQIIFLARVVTFYHFNFPEVFGQLCEFDRSSNSLFTENWHQILCGN